MEVELGQGDALDVLRLDVVDAGDQQEQKFGVVGQVAFHLRGVHAAVRLDHVDDRHVHLGKDVDRHPLRRQNRGQHDADHARPRR